MIEHLLNKPAPYKAKFSLCVYCGSRPGNSIEFSQVAIKLGQLIASKQCQLVYGGGLRGLMGDVSKSAQASGAPVIGVIPTALRSIENTNIECNELYIVDSMHERKAIMTKLSDAFIALPGGIGTLEEFFEIWSWRFLNYHQAPIAILNINDFYTPLLTAMQRGVTDGFITKPQMDMLIVENDITTLLDKLLVKLSLTASKNNL